MGDEANGGRSSGVEVSRGFEIPSTDKFSGGVPLNLYFKVVKDGLVVDTETGVAEMLVTATITTPEPFNSEFITERPVLVDESVIEEASNSVFPNTASALLPKIISEEIKQESTKLKEMKRKQREESTTGARSIVRAGVVTGFIAGSSLTATIALGMERNGWSAATGWVTLVFGGLAIAGFRGRDEYHHVVQPLEGPEADKMVENLTLLRLIESAVQNRTVMNNAVGYTEVAEVSNLK